MQNESALHQDNTINNNIERKAGNKNTSKVSYITKLLIDIRRDKFLYLLALPGLIFFLIFKYIPIWGISIAFMNYSPFLGFMKSDWVGFANFQRFFSSPDFLILFRNNIAISSLNLVLFFPLPIIVSLMLNEIKSASYKRVIQSVIYIPHFLSWVIIYALTFLLFSQGSGIVNIVLAKIGMEKIDVLTNQSNFWFVLAMQNIWKETGWGTIVFLAAIAGIDVQMYEAARLDGAGRLRQMIYITLPSIAPIIVIMFILRLGTILDVGFEQIFLMYNGAVSKVADVFDYYSYRLGIQQGQFSFSTSVGLFKSTISLVLVLSTNKIAKRFGYQGVY